jgi:biotin carboxylase
MKSIMILGASDSQIPFIEIAKNKGYKVIATDINANAIGLKYADIGLNIDMLDKEIILQEAIKYNISGILTKTEPALRTISYVCDKLNLKGLSDTAAQASHNKLLLRQQMKDHGIAIPKLWSVSSIQRFDEIKDTIEYPVIIKPVDSASSKGVVRCENENDVKEHFDSTYKFSGVGEVMIEEFLEGSEFSVETITQFGKIYFVCITEKTTGGYPYNVETRHIIPANLTMEQEFLIKDVVKNTLSAINVDNAVAHTEVMLTNRGAIVIETGARLGGDYIGTDLITLATGINMCENIINLAIGEPVRIEKLFNRYSGVQFLTYLNYRNAYKKHTEIINDKNYIKHEYYEMENKDKLTNSTDRLGYYIFASDDRNALINNLDCVN